MCENPMKIQLFQYEKSALIGVTGTADMYVQFANSCNLQKVQMVLLHPSHAAVKMSLLRIGKCSNTLEKH